jgi:5'-3' exonuclease
MTITRFNKFISDNYEDLYTTMHLSEFAFKKVPWDIASYIYSCMHSQGQDRDKWLQPFIRMLLLFRKHAVNVIPIFDGKAPPEKAEERADRAEQKTKSDEKCIGLRLDLQRFKTSGIKSPELIKFMKQIRIREVNEERAFHFRSLLHASKSKDEADEGIIVGDDVKIEPSKIEAEITGRERNLFTVAPEDIILLKNLLNVFKIPFFQAPDEAEALGCYLVKQGLADAIYSLDSDCIAYGPSMIINNIDIATGDCRILRHAEVCDALELTPSQLVDVCILCGTDYNRHVKNIKGVGPVRAVKIIQEYKTVEAADNAKKLPRDNKDDPDTGLRYARNIELFSLSYPDIKTVPVWDLRIDTKEIEAFISKHELYCNMDEIKELWQPPKIHFIGPLRAL